MSDPRRSRWRRRVGCPWPGSSSRRTRNSVRATSPRERYGRSPGPGVAAAAAESAPPRARKRTYPDTGEKATTTGSGTEGELNGDRCGTTPTALQVAGPVRGPYRDRPAPLGPGGLGVLAVVGRGGRTPVRGRGRVRGRPSGGPGDHLAHRGDRSRPVVGVRPRRGRRPASLHGDRGRRPRTPGGGPPLALRCTVRGRALVLRCPAGAGLRVRDVLPRSAPCVRPGRGRGRRRTVPGGRDRPPPRFRRSAWAGRRDRGLSAARRRLRGGRRGAVGGPDPRQRDRAGG